RRRAPRFRHEVPSLDPGGDTRCAGVSIRALVAGGPKQWWMVACPVPAGDWRRSCSFCPK
uniref:Uncharacterized protein n=1 Tax=Aegilops tauschii subsp. strangulata TaxID=200361 RepID=A0A452XT58_AEGTS